MLIWTQQDKDLDQGDGERRYFCGPFEKKKGQDKVRGQREKTGAEVGVFKDMI